MITIFVDSNPTLMSLTGFFLFPNTKLEFDVMKNFNCQILGNLKIRATL